MLLPKVWRVSIGCGLEEERRDRVNEGGGENGGRGADDNGGEGREKTEREEDERVKTEP